MFEKAVRSKLRFQFNGLISVEDLWDLDVRELDTMFKKLHSDLEAMSGESLLDEPGKEEEEIKFQIDIIKRIVNCKLDEKAEREKALDRTARKQRLLEIIASKQDAALNDMSIEELNVLVGGLE